MKFTIRMFSNNYRFLTHLVLIFCMGFPVVNLAKSKQPEDNERVAALDEMTFSEMINSVDVGNSSALIQKFQSKEATNKLINSKFDQKKECNIEAYRNKEVLLVTIPADLLFDPNDTELKASASNYLNYFKRYLKDPDMYRVLLVMHTDNTGSEEYRENITLDRVNSVFDWFEDTGCNTKYLFSYAFADQMPLNPNDPQPNDSMEKRKKNRRLEIYLMPGTKMVEQAKKGRIAF